MKHLIPVFFLLACGGSSTSGSVPASVTPTAANAPASGGQASANSGGQLAGYDGMFASDPKLTAERVALWSAKELPLKRNEIYARYGRAFQSEALRAHFEGQGWYKVSDAYSDALLTDNDKANAALIKSFEGKAPVRDGQEGKLMFMDASSLIISDDPSMYGMLGDDRYYVARGPNRVVTWSGPETLDLSHADLADLELWTWKGSDWERSQIPRPQL